MQKFTFKKLELQQEGSWLKRTITSPHVRRTVIYATIGAVLGFVLYYLSDEKVAGVFWNDAATKHVLMGLGMGVFITNSPCSRGRC